MDQICNEFHISRQAHYQQQRRDQEKQIKQEKILHLVQEVRSQHPRMGTRKVLDKITPEITTNGLKIGRDGLFDLLRDQKMLVYPRKSRRRTTIPGLYRTPNLLPGMIVSQPNQVWVGDITFIDVEVERFVFLFLLMDLYSRFIIGWHVASSLSAEGAIQSLRMALRFQKHSIKHLIHHSDHGSQYTSSAYMKILLDHEVRPSMGAIGNCYDNIFAERVLGTLKNEYLLGDRFVNYQQVTRATKQIIHLYNTDRPHLSLNGATPIDVYFDKCIQLPPLLIPEEVS